MDQPGNQVYFYTIPSLDPVPNISPLRNVVTFAVDEQHLRRPPLNISGPTANVEPVDLCIIKRTSIQLYQLREILLYQNASYGLS
jgi:vacuolar protein sorting-associated protein 3